MVKDFLKKGLYKKSLLLSSVLVLAFLLRFYKVWQVPSSLYWDEAAMALDAKAVAQTGKDQHGGFWLQPIYPSWGDYKLPGYIIAAAPFFNMISFNVELAVRLPSVLAGTLTVLLSYFFVREILTFKVFKKQKDKIALLFCLLLAISPWHLQFSRAAFEANLALLFNFSGLLFFIKGGKKKEFWLVSLIFLFLGVYTYYSARIILPLLILFAFVFYWRKNLRNIIYFSLTFLVFVLMLMPLYNSPIAPQAEQLRLSTKNILNDSSLVKHSSLLIEQDGKSFLAKKIHHRFLYFGKAVLANYFEHFSFKFLLLKGDDNLRHSTGITGVLFFAVFIGFIYGQYVLFKRKKKLFLFLNLSMLACFLPACIPYEVPHALRSLNAVIFLNFIAGAGLVCLFKSGKLVKYFLIITLICQFVFYVYDYYKLYPQRSFLDWQYGYKEAVWLATEEYKDVDKVYFTNAHGRSYLYFLLYSDYTI